MLPPGGRNWQLIDPNYIPPKIFKKTTKNWTSFDERLNKPFVNFQKYYVSYLCGRFGQTVPN
jgi:hypothetical protein